MKPRTRQTVLFGILLATGLAAFFAPPVEKPVESVTPANNAASTRQSDRVLATPAVAEPTQTLSPEKRTLLSAMPKDLFYIKSPPPVATETELQDIPQPSAPPLPYVYMGKSVGQGQITVFLTRDEKPYVARMGDILDDHYRVDAINPPVLEFTYLPLAQKQMLHIGVAR